MSPRAEQVRDLFCAAIELPPTARAAYLQQHCADAELRREVAELLEQSPAPGFLEPPPIQQLLPTAQQFGPFLVLETLPTQPASWLGREPGHPDQVRVELVHGSRDDAALARFAATAYRAAAARLPGLLGTVRHGRLPEATYVAEQTCAGHPLDHELLPHLPAERRLLPAREREDFATACRHVVAGLAMTLARLHALGVVHGDLRSGRVWLEPGGHARLFGLGLHLLAGRTEPTAPPLATATAGDDIRGLLGVLADLLAQCPPASPLTQALQALHRSHTRKRHPDLHALAADLASTTAAGITPKPRRRWLPRWLTSR